MRCLHGDSKAPRWIPWTVAGNDWPHGEAPPNDAKSRTTLPGARCAAHESSSHSLVRPNRRPRNVHSSPWLRQIGQIRTNRAGWTARPRPNALSLLGLRSRTRQLASRRISTKDGRQARSRGPESGAAMRVAGGDCYAARDVERAQRAERRRAELLSPEGTRMTAPRHLPVGAPAGALLLPRAGPSPRPLFKGFDSLRINRSEVRRVDLENLRRTSRRSLDAALHRVAPASSR